MKLVDKIIENYISKSKILEKLFHSFHRNLIYNKEVFNYCQDRGITKKSIDMFCLGYDSGSSFLQNIIDVEHISYELLEEFGIIVKNDEEDFYINKLSNRIIFPIQDIKGNYTGFSARIWKEGDKRPKYINSNLSELYQKSLTMYGLYQSIYDISMYNLVLIVEGNIDVISCHQEGIKIAVATCGSIFKKEHLLLLKQFTNRFIFCFDNDEAGKRATEKARELLKDEKDIKIGYLQVGGTKDLNEFLQKGDKSSIINSLKEFDLELV